MGQKCENEVELFFEFYTTGSIRYNTVLLLQSSGS